MRLSTTINLFIPPFETSREACVQGLERYKRLGYDCLDAIMCSAYAPASPLRLQDWRDWAAFIRAEAVDVYGRRAWTNFLPLDS